MSQQFSADLEQFLQAEIAAGVYPDRDSALADGLRLLRRERAEAQEGIQAGWADFEDGRFQSLDETFLDLRREFGLGDR
jgi:Arc/MetJ-type ribon-helix-helix transcriptional regulator